MKIVWLVADVTAVGSPDRAERGILGEILIGRFLGQFRLYLWPGTLFWCRTPLLSSNKFTQGHSMKIKWLVADVTAVGSPDRAEHAILGVILVGRCFGQFRLDFWSGSHFVM